MSCPAPLAHASALSGAWRIGAVALSGAVAAALAAWAAGWGDVLATGEPSPLHGAAAALVAGALAATAAALRLPSAIRRLSLTPSGWVLTGGPGTPPVPGTPSIALDLDRWLLVRFDPAPVADRGHGGCIDRAAAPRPRWLPLSAAGAGTGARPDDEAWSALRAALWTWRPDRASSTRPEGALPR